MNELTLKKSIEDYTNHGYCIIKIFDEEECLFLEEYTQDWIYKLIEESCSKNLDRKKYPLSQYHEWWEKCGVNHGELCRATNRYISPDGKLKEIILNKKIFSFLESIEKNKITLWADPGLGWFGFRMIRPGMNDGYPPSCKNWGAAAGVISIWLPIIGLTSHETLAVVKGSHLQKYERYLPVNSKFTSGEFRLASHESVVFTRPELKRGEIIFYHPGLLHTENISDGSTTRVNLEYRFMPKKL